MKGGTGTLQAIVEEEEGLQSYISVMSLHCLALDGTRITIKYAVYLQYHIIYTYSFVDNNTLYHGTTKRYSLQIAKQ